MLPPYEPGYEMYPRLVVICPKCGRNRYHFVHPSSWSRIKNSITGRVRIPAELGRQFADWGRCGIADPVCMPNDCLPNKGAPAPNYNASPPGIIISTLPGPTR